MGIEDGIGRCRLEKFARVIGTISIPIGAASLGFAASYNASQGLTASSRLGLMREFFWNAPASLTGTFVLVLFGSFLLWIGQSDSRTKTIVVGEPVCVPAVEERPNKTTLRFDLSKSDVEEIGTTVKTDSQQAKVEISYNET